MIVDSTRSPILRTSSPKHLPAVSRRSSPAPAHALLSIINYSVVLLLSLCGIYC